MAFSIKQLLFCMAVVAFGLIAFLNANTPYVAEIVDLLTLATLILIAYGIWMSEQETRAFRIGFLCWAVLYHLLFGPEFNIGTDDLLDLAFFVFRPNWSTDDFMYDTRSYFQSIGHRLCLLFFGLIGGWVTVYFYRKRQRMRQMQA